MCLIAVAHRAHPALPLVVAANRDEAYARPASPAGWWADAPGLLAGRDLHAGGSWLGVTRGGRFAAVTNFREGIAPVSGPRSRGALVTGFLTGDEAPEAFAGRVAAEGARYAGFNLLVGDGESLVYLSNRAPAPRRLEPGIYALSNHLLDTPWPKVLRARQAMEAALAGTGAEGWEAPLWAMLADRAAAEDAELPETGVGPATERLLSPPFITSAAYGTRASTVLARDAAGAVRFVERARGDGDGGWRESRHHFRVEPAPRPG